MMVGAGDEITPRVGGHGRLRASDSDRAHVIDILKAAYVSGLVTKDVFDERVSQTLASRTRAELAPVTADLPAAHQRPGLARTGTEQYSSRRERQAGQIARSLRRPYSRAL